VRIELVDREGGDHRVLPPRCGRIEEGFAVDPAEEPEGREQAARFVRGPGALLEPGDRWPGLAAEERPGGGGDPEPAAEVEDPAGRRRVRPER
jgi:hypothetical protein